MPPRIDTFEIDCVGALTRRRSQRGQFCPGKTANAAQRAHTINLTAGQKVHITSLLIIHDVGTSLNLRALSCGLFGSVSSASILGGMA